ncbi:hypothetical protein DdX_05619 [Ditylenchus destructor]|uniref:Uncharacterized protein n=1 Tax=Ditylenchus destructor TaxID=166010 RepID=A0AAD4R9Z4_9BILA|nr:hypothetical protein DdX_05619 [Ditylenchus destructor]
MYAAGLRRNFMGIWGKNWVSWWIRPTMLTAWGKAWESGGGLNPVESPQHSRSIGARAGARDEFIHPTTIQQTAATQ